jgi:type VI secretion system protein ImpH
MAAAGRRAEDSVADCLLNAPYNFEFFQAVRLLMLLMPGREPAGGAAKPAREVARFASRVTLEFPASAIHEIDRNPAGGGPPLMTVAFFGLMGTHGVLPFHYTEWMLARQSARDTAMAAFLNLFNHRWISLFYRAWEKHQLPMAFERSMLERQPSERLNSYLFDLVGLGTKGLRGRLSVRDETLLLYAGLAAQRPRSASALRGILRDYFDLPVEVLQFQGSWHGLGEGDFSYLSTEGLHNQLGVGAVAGDAVWIQEARFRIRIGPLQWEQFCSFLPGGRAMRELEDLTRFFLGTTPLFDVQLVLEASQVPRSQLREEPGYPPRLGWDSWLTEQPLGHDAGDAIFAEAA